MNILRNSEQIKIDENLSKILIIGKAMSENNKALLAESLYKFFDDDKFIRKIQSELDDPFSMTLILEGASMKIQKIKEDFYEY